MAGNVIPSLSPLVDLVAQLGVPRAALAAVEGAGSLTHAFTIDGENAARLQAQQAVAFVEEYGDAARAEVRTGDLAEIVLAPGVRGDEVGEFAARAHEGGPYELWLEIDKDRLAARIAGATQLRSVRLYLFSEALRRALRRGVNRFESEVWQHAPAPMVIGVIDTDIDLRGPWLTVLGGRSLPDMADAARVPAPQLDLASLQEARDRHVSWDFPWVAALTPWHFELSGVSADDELRGLLHAQLVKLAVLFTCDRARKQVGPTLPSPIRAEYRGREHMAVVSIDEGITLKMTDEEAQAVLSAVDWCYRRRGQREEPDWVSDRLPFLQTRLAQTLEPHTEDDRLAALPRAMPYLIDGIEWHWKAFVEGKVGQYLGQVQAVESAVADTVTSFADRATALVKSLGETILAAVAVLIGAFIAAAFRDPFDADLFRIALRVYAVYVLVFPALLGLSSSHHGFRTALRTFTERARRFKETLHPDRVDSIISDRLRKAKNSYYRWLALVAVIYFALSVLTWVGSTVVPDRIADDAIVEEATATLSPTALRVAGT